MISYVMGNYFSCNLNVYATHHNDLSFLFTICVVKIAFYSQRLRTNGHYLSESAFMKRKLYLVKKKTGLLREKVPTNPSNPMMSNPNMMMDMMKGNMVNMVPNFALMTFVSYFFSGFVCLKLPFPLPSNRFKVMMQRGIDLSTLDVSYVSSLSWYFIVSFGLNGVYRLILGENVDMTAQMMEMQVSHGERDDTKTLSTASHNFMNIIIAVDGCYGRWRTSNV